MKMGDLTDTRLIKLKAILFVFIGLFSGSLLVIEHPTIKATLLLMLCVWCFCRAYYFAFYVVERYVDPGYRFSGLGSFVRYVMQMQQRRKPGRQAAEETRKTAPH